MQASARRFYDELASEYHSMFEDWDGSIERQARTLGPLLERECGRADTIRVLDCACGIGTQTLGLAARGFRMTGSDISEAAIERARAEASKRGLDVSFAVADLRDLDGLRESGFDAAIAMDNALPHLESEEELARAAAQIRGKLRSGGIFVASIRDYDRLIRERPTVQGPAFYSDGGSRRIVFQLWDWLDERRYAFHLYITRQTESGWDTRHFTSTYRAVLRDELTSVLLRSGFRDVRWLFPEESGYYQPMVFAR